MKHRQEYRMIEWIRQKRINHLYKKACKAMAKFDNAIGKDNKNLFMKQLLNRVYGTKYMNTLFNYDSIMNEIAPIKNYADTDSVIYKDFNKKSEV